MGSWLNNPIEGVLLDITGVLYESGEGFGTVIPGSVNAVQKLKDAGIPVRLVTNETCDTRSAVVKKLQSHGYDVCEADIFSPAPAMIALLKERGLSPHLLVHPNYYKHKGKLQLDVGAFANALEFACDIKSEIVGKPSPQFFGAALKDMGITADKAVMIGDDIVSDVGGSQKCGLRGVLVRTGKYIPAFENHPVVKQPDFIADNLAQAVEMIVNAKKAKNM